MIRVGLVGEDPNDTSSIKNLLNKRYKGKVQFFPLVKGIMGYQLDNPKIKRSLPIEFEDKRCRFVIYIRDLDGLASEEKKVLAKIAWFKVLDKEVNNSGVLLLNIWELEALILGDIDTFNSIYGTKANFSRNPMFQKEPKELLKHLTSQSTRQFTESHCPEIFSKLDIDIVEAKCSCFSQFITEFEKRIE